LGRSNFPDIAVDKTSCIPSFLQVDIPRHWISIWCSLPFTYRQNAWNYTNAWKYFTWKLHMHVNSDTQTIQPFEIPKWRCALWRYVNFRLLSDHRTLFQTLVDMLIKHENLVILYETIFESINTYFGDIYSYNKLYICTHGCILSNTKQ